jgi:hypothetical protein
MEGCPLNRKEKDETKPLWLVIPFDRPVQVEPCSIVSLALLSTKSWLSRNSAAGDEIEQYNFPKPA